jgi:hypothetical protein
VHAMSCSCPAAGLAAAELLGCCRACRKVVCEQLQPASMQLTAAAACSCSGQGCRHSHTTHAHACAQVKLQAEMARKDQMEFTRVLEVNRLKEGEVAAMVGHWLLLRQDCCCCCCAHCCGACRVCCAHCCGACLVCCAWRC